MNLNSHILYAAARLRESEMRVASEKARKRRTAPDPFWEAIVVRLASAQDRETLERLAAQQLKASGFRCLPSFARAHEPA